MTTFTPPIGEGQAWGDYRDLDPHERLMSFFGTVPTGETVWKDENGDWHQAQYPTAGNETSTVHDDGNPSIVSDPTPGLLTAEHVFQGGHTYHISTAVRDELVAEGYGDFINTDGIRATWSTEDLAPFDTKMLLTADGTHATGPPRVTNDNKFTVQLSAGTIPGQSNLREFFLTSDTAGWTDSRGLIELDPPLTNVDGVLPQMGAVLRAQFNSVTGKNQGITLNNGVAFGLLLLNIGVWHAFPDGTGFDNRQYTWPFFDNIDFPPSFEWELIDNIVRVRQFIKGTSPDTTPWDHPIYAHTVNLDTDAGNPATIPTPTGPGTNGIIVAHLGTDSRSAARIRRFEMEKL
jgi:hypothetical protein